MAQLIYTAICSLDGYHEDAAGSFEWAQPDEEVHAAVNDLERPIGTYLLGRRMYETMTVWETEPSLAADSPIAADYARTWIAADKVVYSTTLTEPRTSRTRIEASFDRAAVAELKASSTADLGVGGPELAATALAAGLVDEIRLLLNPIIVGGGKRALPDGVRLTLDLVEERRFGNGVVLVRYTVRN